MLPQAITNTTLGVAPRRDDRPCTPHLRLRRRIRRGSKSNRGMPKIANSCHSAGKKLTLAGDRRGRHNRRSIIDLHVEIDKRTHKDRGRRSKMRLMSARTCVSLPLRIIPRPQRAFSRRQKIPCSTVSRGWQSSMPNFWSCQAMLGDAL